jgi:hypothetical protein
LDIRLFKSSFRKSKIFKFSITTKIIISDDCRIKRILGELIKLQSDEIPKQRIKNEKKIIYLSKYSKFKPRKQKIIIPPIRGMVSLPANF